MFNIQPPPVLERQATVTVRANYPRLSFVVVLIILSSISVLGCTWGAALFLDAPVKGGPPDYASASSKTGHVVLFLIREGTMNAAIHQVWLPEHLPAADRIRQSAPQRQLPYWSLRSLQLDPRKYHDLIIHAYGWPFLGMYFTEYRPSGMKEKGILLSKGFGAGTALPIGINTPYFVANIGIHALIWSLLLCATKYLTILRRRVRGRCPCCGYELLRQFDAGCPECGWNRPEGEGKIAEVVDVQNSE